MTKSLRKISVLFGAFLLSCAPASWAQSDPDPKSANDPAAAMLVLDASGSMWGKIGQGDKEQHKIEIARDVIDDMTATWDTGTPLGLMAYGHRKKGDCSDIELLLPPAPLDAKVFSRQVRALNPTGKTPMVQSVINAAEALSYENQKSTVILVSDGEETCGMDACDMGRALKEKGVDFTAHVIGFDVSLSESAGMRCLAETTGGRYMDAENAEELSDAMIVVAEDTTTTEPYKDVVGPATVNVVPDEVIGGSRFEVEWTGPENRRDRLVITSADGKTHYNGRYIVTVDGLTKTYLRAPETPGQYQVHYITRNMTSLAFDDFTILPPKAVLDAPDTDIVGGSRFDVKVSEPNNQREKLAIFDKDDNWIQSWTIALNYQNGIKTITAPETPGTYTVKYVTREGNVLASDEITVIAAEASVQAPDTPIPGGGQFMVSVSAPNSHKDKISFYDSNGKRLTRKSWTVKMWRKDGEMKVYAPEEPGTYTVNYISGDKKILASDEITVIPATAEFDAPDGDIIADSRFQITVSEPNSNKEKITLFNAEGKRLKSWTVSMWRKEDKMTLTAPEEPGTYELQYLTRDRRILARETIMVTPK